MSLNPPIFSPGLLVSFVGICVLVKGYVTIRSVSLLCIERNLMQTAEELWRIDVGAHVFNAITKSVPDEMFIRFSDRRTMAMAVLQELVGNGFVVTKLPEEVRRLKESTMIHKYKKKPIVAEAVYFDGEPSDEIELWLGDSFESWVPSVGQLIIRNLLHGSELTITEGNYIIKGSQDGDFYPCDQVEFGLTYELVDE